MDAMLHSATPTVPLSTAARAIVIAGLMTSLFANLASQFAGIYFTNEKVSITAMEVAWMSAAYATATTIGMVAGPPLEQRLGVRRYFVANGLAFATFGLWLALMPSMEILVATRVFEGFAIGAFGPRALLGALRMLREHRSTFAGVMFVLLVSVLLGVAMLAASLGALGWHGVFLLQMALALALSYAGLRWLPPYR